MSLELCSLVTALDASTVEKQIRSVTTERSSTLVFRDFHGPPFALSGKSDHLRSRTLPQSAIPHPRCILPDVILPSRMVQF